MFESFPIDLFLVLAPFIMVAGFIDSIAGGGGLITVPAYLAAGLPAHLVLGTNKLASSIGIVVSATKYYRKLRVELSLFGPIVVITFLGAWLGARTVLYISAEFLEWFLVIAIPLVALFIIRRKEFGTVDGSEQLDTASRRGRGTAVGLSIGFYDGFFGPGTGTFFSLALIKLLRFDLLRATAYARYLNLTSNVAALAAFLWGRVVNIQLGVALGICGMVGHYAGSHMALRFGPRIIRPLLLTVLSVLLIKIVIDLVYSSGSV